MAKKSSSAGGKTNGKGKDKGKAPAPAPTPAAKKHDGKSKATVAERIEKGRKLAASYLEQRDGMDPQLALDIVEGMSVEEVDALNDEANTATLAATKTSMEARDAKNAASAGAKGATLAKADEDEGPAPDFLTIPILAEYETKEHDTFGSIVTGCAQAARTKNAAEKEYKGLKKVIWAILSQAGIDRVSVFGIKLKAYQGNTRTLSDLKLLEKGVSIDIINECWVDTPYDDVRLTVPKE